MPAAPVSPANERLNAQGYAGENSQHHQRQVCHNPISGNPGIPGHLQHQPVQHRQYQSAGQFIDEGRQPWPHQQAEFSRRPCWAGKVESLFPPPQENGGNAQADHRRQARGQRRAKQPHIPWKDQQIVQDHIGRAAAKHHEHALLWLAVVAQERHQQMIQQEKRSKAQDGFQVNGALAKELRPGTQRLRQIGGSPKSRQNKNDPERQLRPQRLHKRLMGMLLLSLRLQHRIACGAAHAKQHAHTIDQSKDRNGNIQSRQSFCPQLVGYKHGIRQDGSRRSQHAQDTERYIPDKRFSHCAHGRLPFLMIRESKKRCSNAFLLRSTESVSAPYGILIR